MLSRKHSPAAFRLLFGDRQHDPAAHLLLHGAPHRKHRFQSLVHGRAVHALHPGGQSNQLALQRDSLLHNPQKLLHPGRIPFALVREFHHVSGQHAPAVSKGHPHLHPGLQGGLQRLGHPVLKGPVQLLQRNVYDHIGVFHFFPSSSRTSWISTRSSIGYLTPLISW